jgi:hypothetical protein
MLWLSNQSEQSGEYEVTIELHTWIGLSFVATSTNIHAVGYPFGI